VGQEAQTEYAKTLRFFFLDWMGKKSLVECIQNASDHTFAFRYLFQ